MRLVPILAVVSVGCIDAPTYVAGTGGAGGGTGGAPATVAPSSTGTAGGSTGGAGGGTTTTGMPNTCGDWVLDVGEVCEDGNTFPGDGCSPECQLEAFCGNNVVEPGELCDGSAGCGATCTPGAGNACVGAPELAYGEIMFLTGPPIAGLPACGSEPTRYLGWYDTGPLPMRLVVRFAGTSETFRLSLGCETTTITGCDTTDVTEMLPAHSLVWLAVNAGAENQMRGIQAYLTRWGSFFSTNGDGMTTEGSSTFQWTWVVDNGGEWIVQADGPGQAILVTPPVDLSGLEEAAVHFHSVFAPGAAGTAVVELSTDGTNWVPAGSPPDGEDGHYDLTLPGAAGQSAVQLRFVLNGQSLTSWAVRNVFIGPPVPGL